MGFDAAQAAAHDSELWSWCDGAAIRDGGARATRGGENSEQAAEAPDKDRAGSMSPYTFASPQVHIRFDILIDMP
jgi:hypothetical protein